jgi:hypothetical protein
MQKIRAIAILCTALASATAAAHPPPQCRHEDRHGRCIHDDDDDERERDPEPEPDTGRPAVEWSSWIRLAMGMKARLEPVDPAAIGPRTGTGQDRTGEAALGAEATLGLTRAGNLRFGPWLELRGFDRDGIIGGAELVLTAVPKTIDMFLYDGQGILMLRAGANLGRMTGQVAYGYLAPWDLFGSQTGASRYMIGVRFVGTFTRAIDDARDWSATIGLEVEPFGALRYLLGIRSWYH